MPTVFSHPAPVLALAAALGPRVVPPRLLLFGVFCAVLPDLDVIGFKLGIRYADLLGHRGFSHSLLFALLLGLLGAALAPWLRCSRPAACGVALAGAASHILLDAMTNGGLGVAALWPFDTDRYFLDWRPIRVSPLNLHVFFGRKGLE
ncbi:MAG: metal-dependent hydrolase, partial [Desulfovibrio sp.]